MPERFVDQNHHKSFDYQGVKFLIHNPYEMFSKLSASHTTIANSSMVVFLNPQTTIIDEVLKGYEPKRSRIPVDNLKDFLQFVDLSDVAATSTTRNR
jgi:hypothetical protein